MRAKVIVALTFLSFSVLSSGQAGTQKLLYTFTGGEDGGQPYQAGVIFDQAGNLYGVTEYGGAYNKGTVYQLTPSPSGPWTENVLYSFTGGTDGARPQGGLAIDGAGNLYGTTSDGGVPNVYCGTVFSLSPSESGWTFTILHTFTGGKDGCSPQADVMYSGLVYGTAAGDGCSGNGTLFWMTTSGGGYRANCFEGTTGWYPGGMCGCAVGLCGTSYFGGTQQSGNIWQQGMSGSYLPASLHSFSEKGKVGWAPVGDLTSQDNEWAASGNVYGTTSLGGTGGGGAVYLLAEELTRRGWVWTISALHDFPASPEDGSSPWAGVALDAVRLVRRRTRAARGEPAVLPAAAGGRVRRGPRLASGPRASADLVSASGTARRGWRRSTPTTCGRSCPTPPGSWRTARGGDGMAHRPACGTGRV